MNHFEKALEAREHMKDNDFWHEHGDTVIKALKIASEMQWRPIKEAPRDGTQVLVYEPGHPSYVEGMALYWTCTFG